MGRWSQYRHRGRGGDASGVPAGNAPGDEAWTFLAVEGDNAYQAGLVDCGTLPPGVDSWAYRMGLTNPPVESPTFVPDPCDFPLDHAEDWPNSLFCQIAWTTEGVIVSDWSNAKEVVI